MIIGRLNRRVGLQPPTRTADVDQGYVTEWTTTETVWAEFMKVRAESVIGTDGVRLEIGVRYRTDVKRGWRVVEVAENNTITYEVKGVYDIFRERTVLVCEEVLP